VVVEVPDDRSVGLLCGLLRVLCVLRGESASCVVETLVGLFSAFFSAVSACSAVRS